MSRNTIQGLVVVFLVSAVFLGACASESERDASVGAEDASDAGDLMEEVENEAEEVDSQDQEEKLESLLSELRPSLGEEQQAAFDSVQQQWQEVREADCQWESSLFDGGTVQSDIYEGCMSQAASQRIERLKLLLCEGWGMTGPCEASERYDEPE